MLQAQSILPIGAILKGMHPVPTLEGPCPDRHCVLFGPAGSFLIQYGHIPPGAVLLVRGLFGSGGVTVATLQSFIFEDELQSLWSHVGIMDANLRVWDIMPNLMVRNVSFGEFVDGVDLLAVRRLGAPPFDRTVLQRHIEDQADSTYPNFAQAGVIVSFIQMMSRRSVAGISFRQNELICSTFVDRILRLVANIEILPEDRPPLVLPGHFARSSAFIDVPMAQSMSRLA